MELYNVFYSQNYKWLFINHSMIDNRIETYFCFNIIQTFTILRQQLLPTQSTSQFLEALDESLAVWKSKADNYQKLHDRIGVYELNCK